MKDVSLHKRRWTQTCSGIPFTRSTHPNATSVAIKSMYSTITRQNVLKSVQMDSGSSSHSTIKQIRQFVKFAPKCFLIASNATRRLATSLN